MIRAPHQTRFSALVSGIRPSIASLPGDPSVGYIPAANLTTLAIEGWRMGLETLRGGLVDTIEPTMGESWLLDWVGRELERDASRWEDSSSVLEELAISIGPASAGPEAAVFTARFWEQWQKNLDALIERGEARRSFHSDDTEELWLACRAYAGALYAPAGLLDRLDRIATLDTDRCPGRPYRSLASSVERVQIGAILAAGASQDQACTAMERRVFNPDLPVAKCTAKRVGGRRISLGRH